MWCDCLECPVLEHCSGTCEAMASLVENNKVTVEAEDLAFNLNT